VDMNLGVKPCSAAGYFSSRAAAKGFIRGATSYLQAARQLEVIYLQLVLWNAHLTVGGKPAVWAWSAQ
jgi:hypothetical protein